MQKRASKFTLLLALAITLGCLFLLTSCNLGTRHYHRYERITIAPTCTEEGYQKNICDCGDYFITKKTRALGHTEVLAEGVNPTCTEDGYDGGYCCSVCGVPTKDYTILPATGHKEVIDEAVAPNCTYTGLTEGSHCETCGEVFVEQTVIEIDGKHYWDDGVVTTEPTCTEEGEKTHTCLFCKTETYKVTVPVIPHTYSEEYSSDEHGHYFVCECGAEDSREGHTSNAPATATTEEVCHVCSYVMSAPTGVLFPNLTVEGSNVSTSVAGNTDSFSFALAITIVGNTDFTVYTDAECTVESDKVVTLVAGENVFYIKECHTGAENIYKIVIYRLHFYTVEFVIAEGYPSEFVTVEEGSLLTPPTVSREGYEFLCWNYDLTIPVTSDLVITSEWRNKNDTKYTITHYIQNILDDGYTVHSSEVFYGETGASISAEAIAIEHFVFNSQTSILSSTIAADGSSELKLYYDREMYSVSIRDAIAGEVIGLGSYRYGTSITLEAFSNIGYHFLGWYTEDTYITDLERCYFEIYCDIEARYQMGQYMLGFEFESTQESCTITGVAEGASGTVVLPGCATAIAAGAFQNMTQIERIEIPASVVSIGANAFYGIRAEIIFVVGFNLKTIGEGAFTGYLGDTITIPASVTTIEKGAFRDCSSEIRWGDGSSITTIKEGAFSGYQGESLTLPPRLTNIEKNAFENCIFIKIFFLGTAEQWKNITVGEGNAIVLQIKIYIYSDFNPEREGDYWYYGESGIEIYPTHVHTEAVLSGYAPTCTTAGLTDGVHCSVCYKVFSEQESIPALGHTEVTYPGYAATCAYAGKRDGKICSTCGLETVIRSTIPQLAHSLVSGTCSVCGYKGALSSASFTYTYNSTYGGYLVSSKSGVTYPADLVIPSTYGGRPIVGVSASGFKNITTIHSVELPSTTVFIGNSAFYGCSKLTTVFIPQNASVVENNAFYSCNFVTFYLQASAAPSGFIKNWNRGFPIEYGVSGMIRDSEGSVYVRVSNADTRLVLCRTTETSYTVPEKVMNQTVTSIATYAFNANTSITHLYVPATIDRIYKWGCYHPSENLAVISLSGAIDIIDINGVNANTKSYAIIVTDSSERRENWNSDWTDVNSTVYYGVSEVGTINSMLYCVTEDGIILARYTGREQKYVVPDTIAGKPVIEIGKECFAYRAISSLTMPNTVVKIGEMAFYNCTSMSSITLSTSLESIGHAAFMYCTKLGDIVLPESLKSIGRNAFRSCSALKIVVIPESVEDLGLLNNLTINTGAVFQDCMALKGVLIKNSNLVVPFNTFEGISPLVATPLSTVPECWEVENVITGITSLFIIDNYTLGGVTEDDEVVVLKHFGEFGKEVVEIPAQVNGMPVVGIANNAYANDTYIKTVTLPEGLLWIGENAFNGCTAIERITIPKTVRELGTAAFHGLKVKALLLFEADTLPTGAEIAIPERGRVHTNVRGTVKTEDGYLLVLSGDEYIIADYTSSVKDLVLPLSYLDIPITGVGPYAIYDNYSIQSIIVPQGIRTLAKGAFKLCRYVTNIEIADSVVYIGEGAFNGCHSLESLTVPFIGDKATHSIGETVYPLGYFFGSESNSDGIQNTTQYTYVYGDEDVVYEVQYLIPNIKVLTVNGGTLPRGAFMNVDTLTNVFLHDGITSFPEDVFAGCTNLETVSMPTSLHTIGENAFKDTTFRTLYVPSSVEKIHTSAFENASLIRLYLGCKKDLLADWEETVYADRFAIFYGVSEKKTTESGLVYCIDEENRVLILGYVGDSVEVVIPATIDSCTVYDIGLTFSENKTIASVSIAAPLFDIAPYAFYECYALVKVENTSGVNVPLNSRIGEYAFYNCGLLQSANLARDYVGEYAFFNCGALTTKPSSTAIYIGNYAYYECIELKPSSLIFEAPIQFIGQYAFFHVSDLFTLTIKQGDNTYIGERAFFGSQLKTVNLSGVKTISDGAFASSKISELTLDPQSHIGKNAFSGNLMTTLDITAETIGEGAFASNRLTSLRVNAKTIGDSAFAGNANLSSVRVYAESIGKNAFSSCKYLGYVYLSEDVVTVGAEIFYGCTSLRTIYCGASSKPDSWSDYGWIGTEQYVDVLWGQEE